MSEEPDTRAAKNAAMRALSDDDRAEAIDASPNVFGFTVFAKRAKQVQLSESYRHPPPAPADGPPLRHA